MLMDFTTYLKTNYYGFFIFLLVLYSLNYLVSYLVVMVLVVVVVVVATTAAAAAAAVVVVVVVVVVVAVAVVAAVVVIDVIYCRSCPAYKIFLGTNQKELPM